MSLAQDLPTLNRLLAETPRLETAKGNYVLFEHELNTRESKRFLTLAGKVTLRAIQVAEVDLGEPTGNLNAWLADVLIDPYLHPFSARCLRAAEAAEIAFDDALVKA